MKKNNGLVLGGAALAWLLPMAVSFFMVDASTTPHSYKPNIYVFKLVMFVLASAITYYFYKKLRDKKSLTMAVAHVFFATSVLLDMILLVSVFKMPFMIWVAMILPFYVVAFYGIYFLLNYKK